LRADTDGEEQEEERRREQKRVQELGAGGACGDVSPPADWTREGHAAVRLKQEAPEEQDRQDDRDSDDDDLYETHDLNLKFDGGQSYTLARAVFYRCTTRSVNAAGGIEEKWPAAPDFA
jgi:hypothetical protein